MGHPHTHHHPTWGVGGRRGVCVCVWAAPQAQVPGCGAQGSGSPVWASLACFVWFGPILGPFRAPLWAPLAWWAPTGNRWAHRGGHGILVHTVCGGEVAPTRHVNGIVNTYILIGEVCVGPGPLLGACPVDPPYRVRTPQKGVLTPQKWVLTHKNVGEKWFSPSLPAFTLP